jgi:hypothetical protein
MMTPRVLLLHAAATFAMVGLIWFVQIVHYPLFGHVAPDAAPVYARLHQRRTAWVVAPIMLTELVTGLWLVIAPLPSLPAWQSWSGLVLLAAIWISTACSQVPLHGRLAAAFEPGVHRALVRTNWLRTAAWTARGALVLLMLRPT